MPPSARPEEAPKGRGVALILGGLLAAALLVGVIAAAGVVLFYVIPKYTHHPEVEPVRPIHAGSRAGAGEARAGLRQWSSPPAAPQPGRIVANTVPAGARVMRRWPGARLFARWSSIPSPPGTHRLTLALEGYEPAELVLEVAPEKAADPGPIALARKAVAQSPPSVPPPAPAARPQIDPEYAAHPAHLSAPERHLAFSRFQRAPAQPGRARGPQCRPALARPE